MNKKTTGTVVEIKKQYWFKVNQKPFRQHPLDSVLFPYIATVKYTVDGVDYHKRKWIDATEAPPMVGSFMTVIYSEKKPAKAKVLALGEPDDGRPLPPIVFFFIFLVFAVTFLALFFISLSYHHKSEINYDELVYMEFTVEDVRKSSDPDLGDTYWIDVYEADKTIEVNNLLTQPSVRDGLDALEPGDRIYCYLIEGSSNYDAAEIKGEKIILSLDQYKEIYHRNSLIGFIVSPIMFVLLSVVAIKCIIDHIKQKKIKENNI